MVVRRIQHGRQEPWGAQKAIGVALLCATARLGAAEHEGGDEAHYEHSGNGHPDAGYVAAPPGGEGGASRPQPTAWQGIHRGGAEGFQGNYRVNYFEKNAKIRRAQPLLKDIRTEVPRVVKQLEDEAKGLQQLATTIENDIALLCPTKEALEPLLFMLPTYIAALQVTDRAAARNRAEKSAAIREAQAPLTLERARDMMQDIIVLRGRCMHYAEVLRTSVRTLEEFQHELTQYRDEAWKLYGELDNALDQRTVDTTLDALEARHERLAEASSYVQRVRGYRAQTEQQARSCQQGLRTMLHEAELVRLPLRAETVQAQLVAAKKQEAEDAPRPWYVRLWNYLASLVRRVTSFWKS